MCDATDNTDNGYTELGKAVAAVRDNLVELLSSTDSADTKQRISRTIDRADALMQKINKHVVKNTADGVLQR